MLPPPPAQGLPCPLPRTLTAAASLGGRVGRWPPSRRFASIPFFSPTFYFEKFGTIRKGGGREWGAARPRNPGQGPRSTVPPAQAWLWPHPPGVALVAFGSDTGPHVCPQLRSALVPSGLGEVSGGGRWARSRVCRAVPALAGVAVSCPGSALVDVALPCLRPRWCRVRPLRSAPRVGPVGPLLSLDPGVLVTWLSLTCSSTDPGPRDVFHRHGGSRLAPGAPEAALRLEPWLCGW